MRTCEHALSKLLLHKSTSGFVCSAGFYSTKEVPLSFKHTVAPPVVRKRTVSKLADNWCCSWVCVLINSNTRMAHCMQHICLQMWVLIKCWSNALFKMVIKTTQTFLNPSSWHALTTNVSTYRLGTTKLIKPKCAKKSDVVTPAAFFLSIQKIIIIYFNFYTFQTTNPG